MIDTATVIAEIEEHLMAQTHKAATLWMLLRRAQEALEEQAKILETDSDVIELKERIAALEAELAEAKALVLKWACSDVSCKCYICNTAWSPGLPDIHLPHCILARPGHVVDAVRDALAEQAQDPMLGILHEMDIINRQRERIAALERELAKAKKVLDQLGDFNPALLTHHWGGKTGRELLDEAIDAARGAAHG